MAFLNVGGARTCTAVLVQNVGLVFPDFCVPGHALPNAISARFDFLSSDSQQSEIVITEVADIASPVPGLMVAQLIDGNFSKGRGVPLSDRTPIVGEAVFMISHPTGRPQQVSTDCHVVPLVLSAAPPIPPVGEVDMFAYECRSDMGSAGGPIFDQKDDALLGVAAAKDMVHEFRKYGILTAGLSRVE